MTLITGDQVLVQSTPGQPDRVSVRDGSATSAVISRTGEHIYVVPTGVLTEVANGRLDRALFDVKGLIAQRYDDKHRKSLPVIVEYVGNLASAQTRAKQDKYAGTTGCRLLTSIGARAVQVAKGPAFWASVSAPASRTKAQLVEPQIRRIRLDRQVKPALDRSVTQIGVPADRDRGYTGKGVKVAVLDTGIDKAHPDLAARSPRKPTSPGPPTPATVTATVSTSPVRSPEPARRPAASTAVWPLTPPCSTARCSTTRATAPNRG